MSSATTTIASEVLTAPLGVYSVEVMNVNETLAAGTYYLVGSVPGYAGTTATPGNVDGWALSTGVYDEAAGTITSGLGSFVGTTWTEYAPNASYTSPAFTVNGPSCSAILAGAVTSVSLGTQMTADFTPNFGLTLSQAEAACNVTGFNWQQTIDVLPAPSPFYHKWPNVNCGGH